MPAILLDLRLTVWVSEEEKRTLALDYLDHILTLHLTIV